MRDASPLGRCLPTLLREMILYKGSACGGQDIYIFFGFGIFLWTRMRGTRRPFGDATQLWVSHQPMLRRGSVYEYTFGELCMGGHEGMQLPRIFLPCNDCGCGRSHVSQDLGDFFGTSGTTAHYDEMDTFWCGVPTSLLFG